MKKVVFTLLTLAVSISFAKECFVEPKWLKVRQSPDTNSKVVKLFKAGEVVEILDEKDGFYRVKDGWISKEYCSVVEKENKKDIQKAKEMGRLTPEKELKNEFIHIVDKQYAYVPISLTDVSRITCPDEIKWFTYSKEKQIQIQKAGSNLLVKISPKIVEENGQVKQIERGKFPRELLVECKGQIFTLIMLPKEVPTQTIVLKPLLQDKKKAIKFETANPYEETIKELIKYAYKELPIDGYEIKVIDKPYKTFIRLDMELHKVYEGAYYQIREYTLKAKTDIDLHEKLFIPYLPDNTLAIALNTLHLKAGEKGRLFVVLKEED